MYETFSPNFLQLIEPTDLFYVSLCKWKFLFIIPSIFRCWKFFGATKQLKAIEERGLFGKKLVIYCQFQGSHKLGTSTVLSQQRRKILWRNLRFVLCREGPCCFVSTEFWVKTFRNSSKKSAFQCFSLNPGAETGFCGLGVSQKTCHIGKKHYQI